MLTKKASSPVIVIDVAELKHDTKYKAYLQVDGNYYPISREFTTPKSKSGKCIALIYLFI